MLFGIFRLVFCILIFVVCVFLIRRSHLAHKRRWSVAALIAAMILTTISGLIPIENALVTFSSPQAAYQYRNGGQIELVVEGAETDLVVGTKGDGDVYEIIPKSNGGWKLGMGFNTKSIAQSRSDSIAIDVYQYKDSDDYYITVLDINGGPLVIADSQGTQFQCLERPNSALNTTFYTYFAYINGYDAQYRLTVNGKTIIV